MRRWCAVWHPPSYSPGESKAGGRRACAPGAPRKIALYKPSPPSRSLVPARVLLSASNAPNDGVRLLRELLRTRSLDQIARPLGCRRTSVHGWARGAHLPTPAWRERLEKIWGIPVASWEARVHRSLGARAGEG